MLFQIPFPPPDTSLDPPGPAFQLLACILLPILWLETTALLLPGRWRRKISELQFGPLWAAKRRSVNKASQ